MRRSTRRGVGREPAGGSQLEGAAPLRLAPSPAAAPCTAAGVPLELVTTSWFLCLFVNVLPAVSVLRLWDVVLWEGPQARGDTS